MEWYVFAGVQWTDLQQRHATNIYLNYCQLKAFLCKSHGACEYAMRIKPSRSKI